MDREIILIAAVSKNYVIGKKGVIPWRIKEDMDHFRKLTTPHPVIMGRVTYGSIPKKFRPLSGRQNIVLTHNKSFSEEGAYVATSLEDVFEKLEDRRFLVDGIDYSKVFIVGGENVYRAALPYATSLEITHVDQLVEGGIHDKIRHFPAVLPPTNTALWKESKREDREGYSFVTYVRKGFLK